MSSKRRKSVGAYIAARHDYLDQNGCVFVDVVGRYVGVCQRCGGRGFVELHHKRGRLGPLLIDKRHFAILCESCHRHVHTHVNKARGEGWIAQIGEWNRPDKPTA